MKYQRNETQNQRNQTKHEINLFGLSHNHNGCKCFPIASGAPLLAVINVCLKTYKGGKGKGKGGYL